MSERPTIRIPRRIQLVVLPVLLLLGWAPRAHAGSRDLPLLTASVIAFLLNPLVRALQRLRIRRGVGVAVVYLSFAAAMVALIVALGTVVVEQTRSAADRIDAYLTDEPGRSGDSAFDRDVADFESWLRGQGIDVELREQVDEWLADVNVSDLTQEAISFAEGPPSASSSSLLDHPDRRHLGLHAARHAEARALDRPALPAARRPA